MFYKNMCVLLKYRPSEGLFYKFSMKLSETIENAVQQVYESLMNLFPTPYDYVSYIAQKFYRCFKNISETFSFSCYI